MTTPEDPVAKPEDNALTVRRFELRFEDMLTVPLLAPNAARASMVSGSIYLDLGFVNPFGIELSQPQLRTTPVARLVLSQDTARQIRNLINQQLEDDSPLIEVT